MKALKLPAIDDRLILCDLAVSTGDRARSIVGYMHDISVRYDTYLNVSGDPWRIVEDDSFDEIASELVALYEHPTVSLRFLAEMRKKLRGACPVCGRSALGTLDHYLPKDKFPEFAFYSRNLIPCCDRCNNVRNEKLKGATVGERPLQPYFDVIAADHIMSVEFAPTWLAPSITPIVLLESGPERAMVQWHIDNIIVPSGLMDHYAGLWETLVLEPKEIFGDSSHLDDMKESITRHLRAEIATSRSRNSWDGCFWHGLLRCDPALTYLSGLPSWTTII